LAHVDRFRPYFSGGNLLFATYDSSEGTEWFAYHGKENVFVQFVVVRLVSMAMLNSIDGR